MPSVASRIEHRELEALELFGAREAPGEHDGDRRADQRRDLHEARKAVDHEGAVPDRAARRSREDTAIAASASTTIASALTARAERSPAKTPTISSASAPTARISSGRIEAECGKLGGDHALRPPPHGVDQRGRRPAGDRRLVIRAMSWSTEAAVTSMIGAG